VGEATETRPVLRLFAVGEADDETTPEGVAVSALSERDRRAVQVAYLATRAHGNRGGAPWGLVQRGGHVYRRRGELDATGLLADDAPTHITYRGQVFRGEISHEEFHEPIHRTTVEPVASTTDGMEAILRAQFVDARLSRDDLSSAARDVLRTARTDGYGETHPYSDGYREVLRALHRRAYLDGDVQRDAGVDDACRRMVRYDETYYDYRLGFAPGTTS
jgi:hypothetical protein